MEKRNGRLRNQKAVKSEKIMVYISKINDYDIIRKDITECAEYLYNSSLNNQNFIEKIAKKYYERSYFAEARYEGILMGVIAFYCNDDVMKEAFLSMIVVKQEYQKIGVGKKLLLYMESVCQKYGMEKIKLNVAGTNLKAQSFYVRNGYNIEKDSDDVRMIKLLNETNGNL